MTVRPPELGDPEAAARIRRAASAYVTPRAEIEAQHAERRSAAARYRQESEALKRAQAEQNQAES